jgi:hypothetical protein
MAGLSLQHPMAFAFGLLGILSHETQLNFVNLFYCIVPLFLVTVLLWKMTHPTYVRRQGLEQGLYPPYLRTQGLPKHGFSWYSIKILPI